MNILELSEFNQIDIENIIFSRLEESVNIEFKASGALSDANMVKKEISKDVSAMANSDGGILIYGIEERNHVAFSTSFIDGSQYPKEWLESIIIANIQQRIDGLTIYPIRFDGDLSKTIYVVKIPKSSKAPHINGDKKYYKRFNFQSVPMEEYEIRSGYLTVYDGVLDFNNLILDRFSIEYEWYRISFDVHMTNHSNITAKNYKVALSLISSERSLASEFRLESNGDFVATRHVDGFTISTKSQIPIFPEETLTVLHVVMFFSETQVKKTLKCLNSTLKIFSNNEYSEIDLKLGETFTSILNRQYHDL